MEKKFVPLLFAGDINVCSVARAFHEEYGIISHVWGKFPTGPCMDSRIMDYHANEKAERDEKDGLITEDDIKREKKAIQKLTDEYTKKIDELLKAKSAEVMEI